MHQPLEQRPPLKRSDGLKEKPQLPDSFDMSGPGQANLLTNTDRVTGREALVQNIAAVSSLAGAVRSTLGPKGLDKMLVADNGVIHVTNDGVTVLRRAKIDHPIAMMIIDSASAQEMAAHDGTTSTVLLAGEMLQNAWELIVKGIHPATIARGFISAQQKAMEYLEQISIVADGPTDLERMARTALCGKGEAASQRILARLACEAARGIAVEHEDRTSCDPTWVKVLFDKGGSAMDSHLQYGLVLAKQACHPDMARDLDTGRILLLDGGLEKRQPSIDAKIKLTSAAMIEAFKRQESDMLAERVDRVVNLHPDILVCRDGIDDEAIRLLQRAGITAYRRVERPEMELLSRSCAATLCSSDKTARSEDLGTFSSSAEAIRSGVVHWSIDGISSKGMTLVVRGSSEEVMAEVERSFSDALGVCSLLLEDPRLLCGGGATHIALSRRLRDWSEGVGKREQLAILAYAAALEVIPRVLAENAGMDGIGTLLELTAAQTIAAQDKPESADRLGLDVARSTVSNMLELGVVESVAMHEQALKAATAAAVSIIRIDDVLWAKHDPTMPEGVGEEEDSD